MVNVVIDKLATKLEALGTELPARKRDLGPTKRDIIFALAPRIRKMLRGDAKRRWSHADVVDWLGQQGVVISINTFGQYLRAHGRAIKAGGSTWTEPTSVGPSENVDTRPPFSNRPPHTMAQVAPPKAKAISDASEMAATRATEDMQRAVSDPRSL
jgi:hypothetical protein